MRWELLELARFAQRAGFHRDAVPAAAALAYATSGGIDTYDVRAGAPGVGHYVGLWGVDIDRWPEYADQPLHAPHVAAQVAHELHRDHNGFGWSAVYRAGTHRRYVAAAATEATRFYDASTIPRVGLTLNAHRQVTATQHDLYRMHRTLEAIRSARGF